MEQLGDRLRPGVAYHVEAKFQLNQARQRRQHPAVLFAAVRPEGPRQAIDCFGAQTCIREVQDTHSRWMDCRTDVLGSGCPQRSCGD